jgi:type II secretory pathway component PulF
MNLDLASQVRSLLWILLTLAVYVGPFLVLYVIYFMVSLPLRRRERARLVLHLLELGIDAGKAPERALIEAAATRDRSLGARFYQLAGFLESGLRLDQALIRVPRLMPPEISAMLRAGAEAGDLRRALPACRQWLNDSVSQTRGALNYLAVLAFIVLPALPVLFFMVSVFVLPKFEQIIADMGGGMPEFSRAVFGSRSLVVAAPLVLMFLFQALILLYVAGPRARAIARSLHIGDLADRILWSLPWRRSRMKRDFTTMLSLLLDAGVAESRAVQLAADSTANRVFQARAQRVLAQLSAGAGLVDAVSLLDDSGEFRWRMNNVQFSRQGFFNSLRGWLEHLDARAFQQEQTAAQVMTTAVVLVNGACVGAFLAAIFLVLMRLTQEAPLW